MLRCCGLSGRRAASRKLAGRLGSRWPVEQASLVDRHVGLPGPRSTPTALWLAGSGMAARTFGRGHTNPRLASIEQRRHGTETRTGAGGVVLGSLEYDGTCLVQENRAARRWTKYGSSATGN